MKFLLCALLTFFTQFSFGQSVKIRPDKYPSLLWEIRGNGITRPSYLFGTMHVSSKMVFNLSDSFYHAIRSAQVVALETNPGTWQADFSKYDLGSESLRFGNGQTQSENAEPRDYLTINSLKLVSYEKLLQAALYLNPSAINNFLYRSRSDASADFEEDTYLDLHIYQTGKKLGKTLCGLEDFHGSMQLVKEAYADAAKEKRRDDRGYDYDEDFSYRKMEEAYRTGNLDLLDTINKVNSRSAAFDEKFLYRRNDIQAAGIDSILKKGQTVFAGVGAAHLPGNRGVIALLRSVGYSLRPVVMKGRDSRQKDAIESIRLPVKFSRQSAPDGFYSVNVPGALYSFGPMGGVDIGQCADMGNGSYYMVTRLLTNAALLGQSEEAVLRKVDSLLYENIPGRILTKKAIVRSGYKGYEVSNRTRRGDYQRYNIFVTPFEVLIFKMSGNADYVQLGTEAAQFFSSIQLKPSGANAWKKFSPAAGGFEVAMPQEPFRSKGESMQYAAYDATGKTAFAVIRTDVHNQGFIEEDSFDLNLMEESFASSDLIQRQLSRSHTVVDGYPAMDANYRFKDSSVAAVRFLIQGPRYYTLVAKAAVENADMRQFIQSFHIRPFVYGESRTQMDSLLGFSVKTPVALRKAKKLSMYPESTLYGSYRSGNDDDSLIDNGRYESLLVENDSTGEKIYVSYFKPSAYDYNRPTQADGDSSEWQKEWVVRKRTLDTLKNGTIVGEMELGGKNSSRLLRSKSIERNGIVYELQTQTDTLSSPSAFIASFFHSFTPLDTAAGDYAARKTGLFFSQFFSADTLLHKTAVKNIGNVEMESEDFPQLKNAIASLTWLERKYLDVKKDLIGKMASMPGENVSDYLRQLYAAADDTLDLQHTVLETLLNQSTAYAYKTFAGIVEADPPVLNGVTTSTEDYLSQSSYRIPGQSDNNEDSYAYGNFLSHLTDSVKLTAGIYKSLQPLMNLDEYEAPLMELTATLLDSGLVKAKNYEGFLPGFLIEAKQLQKKQVIAEKARAIEKAQQPDGEEGYRRKGQNRAGTGNDRLLLYAKLLLPFWESNPQVPQLLNRMLQSTDNRLRYDAAILLLKNKKPVTDSLLAHFAADDDFRYELYSDLKEMKRLALFPARYKNNEAIARSRLYAKQAYNQPDTVAFLQKTLLSHRGRKGWVYVFKYKENRNDNQWKLATVGLLPEDESGYAFDEKQERSTEPIEEAFTELTSTRLTTDEPLDEQVQKLLKKLVYAKRKSAARFYVENSGHGEE